MRALVATLLAFALAAAAAWPHVHATSEAEAGCAVCVLRHADLPRSEAPSVAPATPEAGEVASDPGSTPVTGAPLGAIPGQSPPAAA